MDYKGDEGGESEQGWKVNGRDGDSLFIRGYFSDLQKLSFSKVHQYSDESSDKLKGPLLLFTANHSPSSSPGFHSATLAVFQAMHLEGRPVVVRNNREPYLYEVLDPSLLFRTPDEEQFRITQTSDTLIQDSGS